MITRTELLPDVFLTAVQTEKFKTGCFSINLLRPLCREEAAKNALLPAVLLRGCREYPDIRSISARLDELFGASMGVLVRKNGEVQLTGLYCDFAEDALAGTPVFAPMADFTARLLLHPLEENGAFLPEIVEGEKQNLLNAIASRINDKRAYAYSELRKRMCENEAFGIERTGEAEDAAAIDETELFAHYRGVLTHSRIEIFYMGRSPAQQAAEVMRAVLSELPRGPVVSASTEVVRTAGEPRRFVQTMDVTQGKLAMGFRTGCSVGDAEYPALVMLNAVFGSGMTSKLFRKVREEMSLCYYASSSVNKYKGVMFVSSGIEFSEYETARREILHQLDECRAGNITDAELESARRYLLSNLRMGMDSPGRMDDFYVGQAACGQNGTMETLAEQLRTVTREQVAQAARRVRLDAEFFLKGESA